MGSMESVPAAFRLTVVEGGDWLLSFRAPPGAPWPATKAGAPRPGTWAGLQVLELVTPAPDEGTLAPLGSGPATAGAAVEAEAAVATLQNRRLVLREATLVTRVSRLQDMLAACPLEKAGLRPVRVWMGPGGPRLVGRCAVDGVEAPFTVRLALVPYGEQTRRLLVSFADVRLFGALPLAAPLVGPLLARALADGGAAPAGSVRVVGPALDIDPLEAMLAWALVAEGWRMPALGGGRLQPVVQTEEELRLHISAAGTGPEAPEQDTEVSAGTPLSWLEGERLPESLAAAEQLLFAGDLAGAETAYRELVAAHPQAARPSHGADDPSSDDRAVARAARARLLALRAGATDPSARAEAASLSAALARDWPDFLPGILHAATAAARGGERDRACALFERAAVLADRRGELEDAALARAAAADAATEAPGPTRQELAVEGIPERRPAGVPGQITAKTAALYAEDLEPETRVQALGQLLDQFEELPAQGISPHDAYASFGRVAEERGDLEYAEEAYWRATSVAGDPARRADDLMAHARVLLARGNLKAAVAELEEALVLDPAQTGVLALLADQTFQAAHWERARGLYALLERNRVADDVIPPALLLSRRAYLAHRAGDSDEAQACYVELARLDPRHLEARQGLAQLALERQDLDAAAARLEEVLRLLPASAVQTLREVRQQLAEIHVGRDDWRAARPYVELVLAQDPRNVPMLQLSTEIYEHLKMYRPAAEALIRLARVHRESRARARVLLRAGALLQDRLDDEARAFDLFLKASDLDPTHAPTALRLLNGYWTRGQLAEAADLADELRGGGPLPDMDAPSRLRLAIAMALVRGDAAQAIDRSALSRAPWDPDLAATIFVQTAGHLAERPPEALQPAIAVLTSWQSAARRDGGSDRVGDGNGDGDRDGETAAAVSTLEEVWLALDARFLADPAVAPPGLAAALAWLALRREAPPS